MTNFLENFLELIFPSKTKCIVCGGDLRVKTPICICENCEKSLPYSVGKRCVKCGEPLLAEENLCRSCKLNRFSFNVARQTFYYEEPISNLIKKLKYNNARYLAKPFAVFLSKCYYELGCNSDIITFVPQDENKNRIRGYNQSKLIAKQLSDITGVKLVETTKKIKNTPSQVGLSYVERERNLKDCFCLCNNVNLKDKRIVLVDDVFTTGATVENISKILKKAGAKEIVVLTLAKSKPTT